MKKNFIYLKTKLIILLKNIITNNYKDTQIFIRYYSIYNK